MSLSLSREMRHYIYTDYDTRRVKTPTLLFECDAEDILEADKQLKEFNGMVAAKEPAVAVYSPERQQKNAR